VLTSEQEASRTDYLFEHYAKQSKHRGDYHFLEAHALTGLGDYTEADSGNEPRH
jgi:hypothetical protein